METKTFKHPEAVREYFRTRNRNYRAKHKNVNSSGVPRQEFTRTIAPTPNHEEALTLNE